MATEHPAPAAGDPGPPATPPLAYATLAGRLALGLNMFMHGATRIPNLDGFAAAITAKFADTVLPAPLVQAFATGLPLAEGTVGLLLLLGLVRPLALGLGVAVMLSLVFGTALLQDWSTLAVQMQYVLYFTLLWALLPADRFSLDAKLRR